MFKDVISTGWWRIHLIIFTLLFGTLTFLFIYARYNYSDEYMVFDHWDHDMLEVFFFWLLGVIIYLIIFRTIVWVKRGFKKS